MDLLDIVLETNHHNRSPVHRVEAFRLLLINQSAQSQRKISERFRIIYHEVDGPLDGVDAQTLPRLVAKVVSEHLEDHRIFESGGLVALVDAHHVGDLYVRFIEKRTLRRVNQSKGLRILCQTYGDWKPLVVFESILEALEPSFDMANLSFNTFDGRGLTLGGVFIEVD